MMYNQIMVRYGDLTLKGKNKKDFLDRVFHLVQEKMKGTSVTIKKTHDRMYLFLNDSDTLDVERRLSYVSGIHSYSLVYEVKSDLEAIKAASIELIKEIAQEEVTFKVEAKRSDKTFFLTSQEIAKEVAKSVLSNVKNLLVDVHNPRLTLHVELRKEATYLYTNEIMAMGGYPVGVAGKGILMLSGGIDSPVSGYLAMKQGVEIECLHFESTPLTSIESAQKVVDLVKVMANYAPKGKIKVHMLPFKELHMALLEHIPESYNITIMRRMMYRIADKLAKRRGAIIIVNGESVGQVASQTLQSMSVINAVTNMPIIRPVATYDKNEIIAISRKIGTYDISIRPFQDCCTVYVPKNPVTRPLIEKCENYEKAFDYEKLIEEAVNNVKTIEISYDSSLNLSDLGLEVRNVL